MIHGILLCLTSLFLVLVPVSEAVSPQVMQELRKAEAAESQKLPKTALEHLDQALKGLVPESDRGLYVKLLAKQVLNQSLIAGEKPEERVRSLQASIQTAKTEGPVLKTILAIWYWRYYQQNQWRMQQRTEGGSVQDNDFTTWDLQAIYRAIFELYQEVLADPALKTQPLSDYFSLVERGNLPVSHCETLFEFLSRLFIGIFTQAAGTMKAPKNAFEIDAYMGAFAPRSEFISRVFQSDDAESPRLAVLKMWQELLRLVSERDRDAILSVDMNRLESLQSLSNQGGLQEVLEKHYRTLMNEFSDVQTWTMVVFELAHRAQTDKRLVEAVSLCDQAMTRFPVSDGASLCQGLKSEILKPELSMQIEHTVNRSSNEATITYRNLETVYLRVYREDIQESLKEPWNGLNEHLDDEELESLLSRRPQAEWTVAGLKPTSDYKDKEHRIRLPGLSNGYYRIFISDKPNFHRAQNSSVLYTTFWVTDTQIVLRTVANGIEGFLVHADSGEPLGGLDVRFYVQNNDGYFKQRTSVRTNSDGFFRLIKQGRRHESFLIEVVSEKHGDVWFREAESYGWGSQPGTNQSVVLYTDRAIYRPGQTVQFKGICTQADHRELSYSASGCNKVKVEFKDSNWQTIQAAEFSVSDLGSFSGSFVIPTDRNTGRFVIQANQPSGNVYFQVEEYKRPKFEVIMDPVEGEPRLESAVKVTGKAQAFAGSSMEGAKFRYRVKRMVRMPWWWFGSSAGGSREIAGGSGEVDSQGKFTITFDAIPDRTVGADSDPTFVYELEVDVTDSSGETRSGSAQVYLGYVGLSARIHSSEWLLANEKNHLAISLENRMGQPVAGQGSVTVSRLLGPAAPVRKSSHSRPYYWWFKQDADEADNESSISAWKVGQEVLSQKVLAEAGRFNMPFNLPQGAYRAVLTTTDSQGKSVFATHDFLVFSKDSDFTVPVPAHFAIESTSVEPGQNVRAFFGTGYEDANLHVTVWHRGKARSAEWKRGAKGYSVEFPVTEDLRGGFSIQMFFTRQNQIYRFDKRIDVPWNDRKLDISLNTFRSKLSPGQKEKWTLTVKPEEGEILATEGLATMYDQSLDAYAPLNWSTLMNIFYQDPQVPVLNLNLVLKSFHAMRDTHEVHYSSVDRVLPSLPDSILGYFQVYFPFLYEVHHRGVMSMMRKGGTMEVMALSAAAAPSALAPGMAMEQRSKEESFDAEMDGAPAEDKVQSQATAFVPRTDLRETAFFRPHVSVDGEGNMQLEFTMPDSLTRWKLMLFAHSKSLQSGLITTSVVTQKDLMVEPNPPRFVRQGDDLAFPAKVSNLSDGKMSVQAQFKAFDAYSGQDITQDLIPLDQAKTMIELDSQMSKPIDFRLKIPDLINPIRWQIVVSSGNLSDGEEQTLPVEARRVYVRESIPLWISQAGKKSFDFDKLLYADSSRTLKHEAIYLQMSSNPAWYAVQALPYLVESQNESSDCAFARLYANRIGQVVTRKYPRIRNILDAWNGTDAMKSHLSRFSELKSANLPETPWVQDAQGEEANRARLIQFFDSGIMEADEQSALQKLTTMQKSSGGWPWFPDGRESFYTTLRIVTGFGRLRNLGSDVSMEMAKKAIPFLDAKIYEDYQNIMRRGNPKLNHYSATVAMYLYARAMFLSDVGISSTHRVAVEYFLQQGAEFWTKLGNRMSEGMTALAMRGFERPDIAQAIVKSLRERSVQNEEMGMYWKDTEISHWWYRAPIETQAMMLEVFAALGDNPLDLEAMKIWLLKQKQTRDWKTVTATSDAVYALLNYGKDLLASEDMVKVTIGAQKIQPTQVEAGTGFFSHFVPAREVDPEMGHVVLEKAEDGIAWGGMFWHYFEDVSRITPHHGGALTLQTEVFVKRDSDRGPILVRASEDKLKVGDSIVMRLILNTDRDLEYVHLKQSRASGTEPGVRLSGWRYRDGLAYYESTRDLATHYFIEYMPVGKYVFESEVKIFHKGVFETGLSEIQSLYAPEFSAHSQSFQLNVTE